MTDLILKLLLKIFPAMRQRYLVWDSQAFEDASYHLNFYLNIGLLLDVLVACINTAWAKWNLLIHITLLVQIFYREFISDGHLKKIREKTESPEQFLDLKCDLITRLTGWLIPAGLALWVLYLLDNKL